MHNNSSASSILLLVVIAIVIYFRRQRRSHRTKQNLAKNQRSVHLVQQWLDPLVEIIIVGGVLFSDLHHGLLTWLFLIIGLAIGVPIGFLRGRFMYVRSLEGSHRVIIERNAAEISVLAVLIIIKTIAHAISSHPTSVVNLIAIMLLGIGIASSIGRVAYITIRHINENRSSVNPIQFKN